ncbi:MAG: methyltransferase domain-containing protein [Acidimicrobiales bacterium]|nr:methyltransferase domain-containing protein [Acidimicrobiales bacterium]
MTIDPGTLAAYEAGAATYAARSHPPDEDGPRDLLAAATGPVLDLGCGTGRYLERLGPTVVGVEPSAAMLGEARHAVPGAMVVRAAAGALPLRPRSVGGTWANKVLQHVDRGDLPVVLADLHRSMAVGAPLSARLFCGDGDQRSDDDLPGRRFVLWHPEDLADLVLGAGFADVETDPSTWPLPADHPAVISTGADGRTFAFLTVRAARARSLPDTVAPGMRLLVCGLNPSLHAADAGVGFAGPGNRFWPAMTDAGLLPDGVDRDPWALLREGRIGMTDLVKRATPRADEVTTAEFRAGVERVGRLCARLAPAAVVVVGLTGWRAGLDPKATAGWQPAPLGPTPVYVMPSTSGLNAGTSRADLVRHLRAAADGH